MVVPSRLLALAVAAVLLATAAGCRRHGAHEQRVIVFAAASLDQVLADLAAHLRADSGLETQVEISGSQEAARKVSEYGLPADLVLVADARVIGWLLEPAHASWSLRFATNELVLAYTDRSRYATEVNTDNWPAILLRPGVKVARADENLAPVGYQTLMCWQLAGVKYASLTGGRDLSGALLAGGSQDLIRPDVTSLVPLLGTRADYAFLYRSVAHGHNLPYVRLSPEVNFADPAQAAGYARAQVTLSSPKRTIRGAPIVYGATVPLNAPHPEAALRFLRALVGAEGRKLLEPNGFTALPRLTCDRPEALPEELRALLAAPAPDGRP